MRKRDLLKSKAASTNDFLSWERYKGARNHTNNDIRKAKRKYFNDNLDRNKQNPKATWNLMNDLYSRKLDKLRTVPTSGAPRAPKARARGAPYLRKYGNPSM